MTICYVGERKYVPTPLVMDFYAKGIHPRDFKTAVEMLACDIWTNNPYIVGCFSFDRVVVCTEDGALPLTEHPSFVRWKDELDAGEMWSCFGEKEFAVEVRARIDDPQRGGWTKAPVHSVTTQVTGEQVAQAWNASEPKKVDAETVERSISDMCSYMQTVPPDVMDNPAARSEVWMIARRATKLLQKLAEWVDDEPEEVVNVSHQERHVLLHAMLDELGADYMAHTSRILSEATVMELLQWSHQQTIKPDEPNKPEE